MLDVLIFGALLVVVLLMYEKETVVVRTTLTHTPGVGWKSFKSYYKSTVSLFREPILIKMDLSNPKDLLEILKQEMKGIKDVD